MKKGLTIFLFLVLFSGYVSADLTNLMYATFPVERYEFMVDEKISKYQKDVFNITCVGAFYISLERKIMKYTCFRLKDSQEDLLSNKPSIFEIVFFDFIITKIVKLDNDTYTFEAVDQGAFKRKMAGRIKLELSKGLFGKVIDFELSEFGQMYSGVMNKYVDVSSEKSKAFIKKFEIISFGDYYAAMGDDSIKY